MGGRETTVTGRVPSVSAFRGSSSSRSPRVSTFTLYFSFYGSTDSKTSRTNVDKKVWFLIFEYRKLVPVSSLLNHVGILYLRPNKKVLLGCLQL